MSSPVPRRPFPWTAAHFVGVGGHSMSGLAGALAELGVPVSGSDVVASARTERVARLGVSVRIGHDRGAVDALPPGAVVVRNTDVPADNAELAAARERGLAVVHRSALLEYFFTALGRPAIAITGTHGKTTTTTLTGLACLAAGRDPAVFVGADAPFLPLGNHRLGAGPVVAEADESDGSFVRYRPELAVVTSLEPEHLEHYGGDFANVVDAMRRFVGGIADMAVMCADDPRVRAIGDAAARPLWYGLGPEAELTAVDLRADTDRTVFVPRLRGERRGRFALRAPGLHNVRNALAAIGVAWRLGCDLDAVADAFADFEGAERRFQVLAAARGITVVDDYAHNPTKVAAAIAGARQRAAGRVLAVFQPHRYNRTAQLWDAFGPAFAGCDTLWLTEIYAPAGEAPVPGVSGAALAEHVARDSGVPVRFVPDSEDLPAECLAGARPGDLILVMGAGSITAVAHRIAVLLRDGAGCGT